MNGRERMARAMRHAEPDRVPVMCQLALGHYFLNAGLPPHLVWYTSEGFAEALVRLQRRYRFDGILINIPGRPADILDEIARLEKTEEGEVITWRNGAVTVVPWDENARLDYDVYDRPTRADFDTLEPDHLETVDDLPGYIWNTYHIPWLAEKTQPGPLQDIPDYFYRTIDLVREKAGPEVSIHGEVFSPFTHYMELFGYENALVGLVTDPGKAEAVLDRLTAASAAWATAQARHGVDAVLISSAFAGAGLISPAMYRQYVLPYERRVTDAVKALGVPIYTHTCGRIGDRLELMEDTGTQGIDTLDPPPLGNVELAEAKRRVGQRMFLKGNMDSVALLGYETPEQVVAEASQRIALGKPGGGYVLSSACSVAPHVQPWKLELLTPLAEEVGRYDSAE
jgi:hypothetical protein